MEWPARQTTWNFSPAGAVASKMPDSPWSNSARSYPVMVSFTLYIFLTSFHFHVSTLYLAVINLRHLQEPKPRPQSQAGQGINRKTCSPSRFEFEKQITIS